MSIYVVCPECEGEGSHAPGFVYTQSDIDQDFESHEEFMEHIEDIKRGQFNTPCGTCKGQRVVVDIITEDGLTTNASERWNDQQEYLAEVAAEQRLWGYDR